MEDFVPDIIKYSLNTTDLAVRGVLERIERTHGFFRQLWWNSIYIDTDPDERYVTRDTLALLCGNLLGIQTSLLRYRHYYTNIATERLDELEGLYPLYLEYLQVLGVML